MVRYAFEDPMAAAQPRSGGGWKLLLGFMVAFAGLGFAGYVYVIPYQKMQHAAGTRQAEISGAQNLTVVPQIGFSSFLISLLR